MKKTWSLNTVHDLLTLSSPWGWVVLIWNVNYEIEKCINIKLPDFIAVLICPWDVHMETLQK